MNDELPKFCMDSSLFNRLQDVQVIDPLEPDAAQQMPMAIGMIVLV
jgi:hypothetical protein